jgi:hypothetical protein
MNSKKITLTREQLDALVKKEVKKALEKYVQREKEMTEKLQKIKLL